MELVDEPRPTENHRGAHHQRAEDAVEEHPVLVSRRHREGGKDQHEDEHVVGRERELDEVAGEELEARFRSPHEPHAEPEEER